MACFESFTPCRTDTSGMCDKGVQRVSNKVITPYAVLCFLTTASSNIQSELCKIKRYDRADLMKQVKGGVQDKTVAGQWNTKEQSDAFEAVWREIETRQGETFYTAKQLPFTYTVRGGEVFTDRKKKSITRATFESAYLKICSDERGEIVGPKTLNVFGAPYVWALFKALGVLRVAAENEEGAVQMTFLDK